MRLREGESVVARTERGFPVIRYANGNEYVRQPKKRWPAALVGVLAVVSAYGAYDRFNHDSPDQLIDPDKGLSVIKEDIEYIKNGGPASQLLGFMDSKES